MTLTDAEQLKFHILAEGITVSDDAAEHLRTINEDRSLTPADYASTTGLILRLDDDVWVNAPVRAYNPNFVAEETPVHLEVDGEGLLLTRETVTSRARFWRPPAYHGEVGSNGKPYNYYVYTHGDRVRLSPMMGCGMVCKFCPIPYEDKYGTKPLEAMMEAIHVALNDPVQPARHMLISGGTPKPAEFPYLQGVYKAVLTEFPDLEIDIMMVPADGLLDVEGLAKLGLNELSINIEIISEDMARQYMRQKLQHGLAHYLKFIESAANVLGPARVRSMLMVGLEPPESTLDGVRLILEAGGVPVLSPFRPDPVTPLADSPPPDAAMMLNVFTAATELARQLGGTLGPACPPCTHNTMTLAGAGATYPHTEPILC
jgi:radical SAM superfamily enzyme YgiQ (UPF0313 family)